jgi:glycerol-3-phosphate acyltransferase PlsX
MGGDDAPDVVIEGARQLLKSNDTQDKAINLVLVGAAEALAALREEFPERVEAVATTEIIEMDEHPAVAVKQKKDSSIVVACRLVKEGRADAFFSAGSTGGAMTAATLIIGRVRGIKRPAIATVIPAPKGNVLLLDAGANTDVTAEYLKQFAAMGEIFAREVMGVPQPRVGLLNVGEEDSKGSQTAQDAYALMQESIAGFAGNAEGTDIFKANFDVIVTDGFTGNIVLKAMEGLVAGLFSELKSIFYSSTKNKLAAAVIKNDLGALKDQLDIEAIGGAPLLGLQAPVVIGHGSSSAFAIENGIRATAAAARQRIPQHIAAAIAQEG